jgi:hypothetical protein
MAHRAVHGGGLDCADSRGLKARWDWRGAVGTICRSQGDSNGAFRRRKKQRGRTVRTNCYENDARLRAR